MNSAQTTEVRQRYSAEKTTVGGITLLTMHGTLNEGFEGRKTATSVRTKKLIVHMADVHRFASWGMSEWMDFLRVTSDCDLYVVECSAYAMSQLNLVTGLLGHAKLVSFYASYRCTGCSEELQTCFLTPRDAIRDIPGSFRQCPSCGGRARLEEYPAAFFETVAARPAFDIDDEVLAFLRTQLNYDLSPDLTRFRAYRRVNKGYTYIRLTGNVGTLPPEVLANACANTTVLDIGGVVFDPAQLDNWNGFLHSALPKVKWLQLLDCPPGFIESAVPNEALRTNLKVRTFQETYRCGTCDTTSNHIIDVAQNLEELVQGIVPVAHCPACRSSMETVVTPEAAVVLRALPARDRDVALDGFLTKARAEPADKLENALAAGRAEPAAKPARSRGVLIATSGIGVLVAAAAVLVFLKLSNRSEAGPPAAVDPQSGLVVPPKPTFTRPEWIISDVPSSGYCHDMINRLMCVGVSSFRANKEVGAAEATEAALEELASTVGLKISDPFFRDNIMPVYSAARSKALSAVQLATQERSADPKTIEAFNTAAEPVRAARHSVVEVLQATAGAAIPAQRSDWYWEEYQRESGEGTEFLVFVRYDVSLDAVRTLVDKYSASTQVLGSSAMTAFPCLAWKIPSFHGGALLTKVEKPLASSGVKPQDVVVAFDTKRVTDAAALAHDVEQAPHGNELKLTIASGGQPERVVSVKR